MNQKRTADSLNCTSKIFSSYKYRDELKAKEAEEYEKAKGLIEETTNRMRMFYHPSRFDFGFIRDAAYFKFGDGGNAGAAGLNQVVVSQPGQRVK
jgi:hypothetical protein